MARKKSDQRTLIRDLDSRGFRERFPQVVYRISPELEQFIEWLITSDPLVSKETSVSILAREALIYWIMDKKRLRLKDFPLEIPEIVDQKR